jgi:hypothetical protein
MREFRYQMMLPDENEKRAQIAHEEITLLKNTLNELQKLTAERVGLKKVDPLYKKLMRHLPMDEKMLAPIRALQVRIAESRGHTTLLLGYDYHRKCTTWTNENEQLQAAYKEEMQKLLEKFSDSVRNHENTPISGKKFAS